MDWTDAVAALAGHSYVLASVVVGCFALKRLPGLLNPGGQLIITSPYTWLEDYTPRKNWLADPKNETVAQSVEALDARI